MPLLPLPPGDTPLNGGDLPVSESSEVLKEFSSIHRRPETAPVRDALVDGFTEGFLEYQRASSYAAAQSNPMLATGEYLLSFADEREVVPGVDESEESIRNRLFQAPSIVTPDAIVDGINAILAPYTSETATWCELELDGVFVHDGTSVWDSFVGTDPNYPDRYYADQTDLTPSGYVPSSGYPRSFVIRIPELVALTADETYRQIIGFVESIKGQGISWTLTVG